MRVHHVGEPRDVAPDALDAYQYPYGVRTTYLFTRGRKNYLIKGHMWSMGQLNSGSSMVVAQ